MQRRYKAAFGMLVAQDRGHVVNLRHGCGLNQAALRSRRAAAMWMRKDCLLGLALSPAGVVIVPAPVSPCRPSCDVCAIFSKLLQCSAMGSAANAHRVGACGVEHRRGAPRQWRRHVRARSPAWCKC